MSISAATPTWRRTVLTPTLHKQCWSFMIGSSLFALGSAPGFGTWAGASASNLCYFIGAWFFTTAGLIQLILSGPVLTKVDYGTGQMVRAEWLAAATQSLGTVLFNVSTTAALQAHTLPEEERFVWTPDAAGSIAFLVSGVFVLVAYTREQRFWNPRDRSWWAGQINMLGCIAFGFSAVGAYTTSGGVTVDALLANMGTFVGAICFFLCAFILLPRWDRDRR